MLTLVILVASYPYTIIHRPKGYGISLVVEQSEQRVMNITSGTVGLGTTRYDWVACLNSASCSLNQAIMFFYVMRVGQRPPSQIAPCFVVFGLCECWIEHPLFSSFLSLVVTHDIEMLSKNWGISLMRLCNVRKWKNLSTISQSQLNK